MKSRRSYETWTAADKEKWGIILRLRAAGESVKQMTTGTRMKRSTIIRLDREYRERIQ